MTQVPILVFDGMNFRKSNNLPGAQAEIDGVSMPSEDVQQPIPEPVTLALVAAGAIGVVARRTQKRR